MRWPWQTEKRSGAYSDGVLSLLLSRATGTVKGDPSALAALETAAGLWSRSLSIARVEPQDEVTRAISPRFLATVGRSIVRHGSSIWAITVTNGRVHLTEASSWSITGGSNPSGWRYALELAGPSGSETAHLPGAAVLHFFWGHDPDRPWEGTSPMGFSASSAASAAGLEQRLSEELSGPVANILAVPRDGGDGSQDDPLAQLKADIAGARGSALLVETTRGGYGEGQAAAPAQDWKAHRLGPAPPDALVKLRAEGSMALLSACGIPPGLATASSDGTAMREGYRRLGVSVRAKARELEFELSAKLERDIHLDMDEMRDADRVGMARVVKNLTDSGFSIEDASKAAMLVQAAG